MGLLKLDIFFTRKIGLLIGVDNMFITIDLPFIGIMFGRGKEAKGINVFGKYWD